MRKSLAIVGIVVGLVLGLMSPSSAHLGEVKAWASQSNYWTVVNGDRVMDDGDWSFKCVGGTGTCVRSSNVSPFSNFMYEHEDSGLVDLCFRARHEVNGDPTYIRIWALDALTGEYNIDWTYPVTGTNYHTVCLPDFTIPDGTVGRIYVKATSGRFWLRWVSFTH